MCNAILVISPVVETVELQMLGTDSAEHLEKIFGFEEEEYAPFA